MHVIISCIIQNTDKQPKLFFNTLKNMLPLKHSLKALSKDMWMLFRSATYLSILLITLTASLYGSTETIKLMYQEALNFDQDLQNAQGITEEAKGVYYENLYAFLPAPLITYGKERVETTFANGRKKVSHPSSLHLIVMQSISAPKVFTTISSYDIFKEAQANYTGHHNTLVHAILSAQSEILVAYESLKSQAITSAHLKKILEHEELLLKQHRTTQANYDLAKTAYEASLNHQIAFKKLISTSTNALYRITGKFYSQLPALPSSNRTILALKTQSLPTYETMALKKNGNVISSRFKVNAERNQMRATRGNFLPYVSYSVVYNNNENQTSDIVLVDDTLLTSIGLTYDFGANPGTIVKQRGTLTRTIAHNRQVVTEIISNLHTSYQNLKNSQNSIKQLNKVIPSAEATVKAMESQYQQKTTRLSELLNAVQHLQDLRHDLINNRYSALTNHTNLAVLSGEAPERILKQLNGLLTEQVKLPESA